MIWNGFLSCVLVKVRILLIKDLRVLFNSEGVKMIKVIFIYIILLISNVHADFFIENTTTGIIKNEGYKLPNGNEFALLKGTYQWINNLGYYGTATCKGLLEKESELSSIIFFVSL